MPTSNIAVPPQPVYEAVQRLSSPDADNLYDLTDQHMVFRCSDLLWRADRCFNLFTQHH